MLRTHLSASHWAVLHDPLQVANTHPEGKGCFLGPFVTLHCRCLVMRWGQPLLCSKAAGTPASQPSPIPVALARAAPCQLVSLLCTSQLSWGWRGITGEALCLDSWPRSQAGGDPPPVMELLTRALQKTLLRLFTLMLFSSNISVIKEINGQEKRPVQTFDFPILMAYLFTPTSVPIGFSLRGLRCKWSSIDTSC